MVAMIFHVGQVPPQLIGRSAWRSSATRPASIVSDFKRSREFLITDGNIADRGPFAQSPGLIDQLGGDVPVDGQRSEGHIVEFGPPVKKERNGVSDAICVTWRSLA